MATHALAERERPEKSIDSAESLLTIAWRRRTALLLGCTFGLLAGVAYYRWCPPVYQSSAQLLLIPKHADSLTGGATERSMTDQVANQLAILRSPLTAERAARNLQNDFLISPEIISRQLTATRAKDLSGVTSGVVTLSARSADPLQCTAMLSAIIAGYQEMLEETYKRDSGETLELIARARDELRQELESQEAAYREFRKSSPLLGREKEWFDVWKERLSGIEARRTALLVRRTELQGEMVALERAVAAGDDRQSLLALVSELTAKAETQTGGSARTPSLQEQLLPLRREEERLLAKFGPDHPAVRSVRSSIESTLYLFARPAYVLADGVEEFDKSGRIDPVQARIGYLKRSLDQLATEDLALSDLAAKEQIESGRMIAHELQDEAHRTEIARTQQLYDGVVKRLQDVGFAKDFGAIEARVLAPPGSGGIQRVQPNWVIALALALLAGIACGAGLVYVAEVNDKRFHGPDQLKRLLGVPVLGHIPRFRPASQRASPTGSNLDGMLCCYHGPRSAEAEAFRGSIQLSHWAGWIAHTRCFRSQVQALARGRRRSREIWQCHSPKPAIAFCCSTPIFVSHASISCSVCQTGMACPHFWLANVP